jgi:hypothetical protein
MAIVSLQSITTTDEPVVANLIFPQNFILLGKFRYY